MSEINPESPQIEESLLDTGEGVSDDDRRDILQEIDQIVESNKIPVTKEIFKIKPRKKGIFLPIFINLIAACIIVGGYYLSSQFSESNI